MIMIPSQSVSHTESKYVYNIYIYIYIQLNGCTVLYTILVHFDLVAMVFLLILPFFIYITDLLKNRFCLSEGFLSFLLFWFMFFHQDLKLITSPWPDSVWGQGLLCRWSRLLYHHLLHCANQKAKKSGTRKYAFKNVLITWQIEIF